jgi:AcrR family transcriptional regulator
MVRKPSPQKRERFLRAALKLFVVNGVGSTSTAAIAREAGTAAGTLFLYFPTKQDLIDELVMEVVKAQSAAVKVALNSTLSAKESFLAIWETTIQWFLADMEAYQYIQQVRDSGIISETVVQESNQHFDFYYTAIQRGLAENAIKPYPLELIGEMLYRAIVAIMNLIKAQPGSSKQEEYIRAGFEIFWNGIRMNPDRKSPINNRN